MKGTLKQHPWNIQGRFMEHSGSIQGKFREIKFIWPVLPYTNAAEPPPPARRNIKKTFREHSGNIWAVVQQHSTQMLPRRHYQRLGTLPVTSSSAGAHF
jgi:hypothetical protein